MTQSTASLGELFGVELAESLPGSGCRVVSKSKCPLFRAHDMSGLRLREHRRRACGKVGIPRFGRDFQARWESPKDFLTERLFHSLPPPVLLRLWQEGPSFRVR